MYFVSSLSLRLPDSAFRSALLAMALIFLSNPQSLVAQEFRIDSQIYYGESTLPASQNVTLFEEKLVCDFLMSNEVDPKPIEVVIYDPHQHLLVLLDMQKKVRVEIPDLQVLKLLDGLRRETLQNEQTKFLINDTFDEQSDWSDGGWVMLTSPSISYRFKGNRPNNVALLPRYYDFLDSFTNMHATDPKKLPPFPRMKLNQSIKKIGWVPAEVQISITPNGFFREPMTATSKHVLTMGLTTKDRELVAAAKRDWLQFKFVELIEYRGIPKPKVPLIARREPEGNENENAQKAAPFRQ